MASLCLSATHFKVMFTVLLHDLDKTKIQLDFQQFKREVTYLWGSDYAESNLHNYLTQ